MNRLWLPAAMLLVACPPAVSTCVPGKQESCACLVGTGLQTCQADGSFAQCACVTGQGGGSGGGTGGGAGGGSGGSGGGGTAGGSGGGTARTDELVSGSRLRATFWVGADGSRAAAGVFWDSQLNTYCLVPAG